MTDARRPEALRQQVAEVVAALLPPGYRAVLFGSRATGRGIASSDWDIGIIGTEPLDGAIVERLRQALDDLPTPSRFDVVDLASVPSAFRERAMRETANSPRQVLKAAFTLEWIADEEIFSRLPPHAGALDALLERLDSL